MEGDLTTAGKIVLFPELSMRIRAGSFLDWKMLATRFPRRLGPPILSLSKPPICKATSRIASLRTRNRAPRESHSLLGSFSSFSALIADDCRYVADVTIVLSSAF